MSYILEALKKAQAERQLGNAPTIHAPQPVHVAPTRAGANRRPLLIGVAAAVLVACAAAMLAWRHQAPVQVAAVAPAPAVPAAATQAPAPVPQVAAVAAPPADPVAPPRLKPKAAPLAPAGEAAPATPVREARRPRRPAEGHRQAARAQPPVTEPAPLQVPAPAAGPATEPLPAARALAGSPAAPAAADNVRSLKELPEAIQREVPKVVFGGYMYSPNPADRLLLIDKMLRHEGEEVAPGLVLEKLLPKAAVMNYRGYRYRVAY